MSDNDKSMIRIQASFTEKLKHENCLDIKEKMLKYSSINAFCY